MEKQEAGNGEKPVTDPMRSMVELVGLISLPAAVLGVAGAYLGWRVSSAYFGSFSIDSGWISSDVIALIMIGHVEIVLLVLLIVAFVLSRILLLRLAERLQPSACMRLLLVLIGVAVLLTVISFLRYLGVLGGAFVPLSSLGASISFLQYFTMLGSAGFAEWGLLYGLVPLAWWMCAVVGGFVYSHPPREEDKSSRKVSTVLSLVFSSKLVWLLLTAALTLFYLSQFAMYHGMYIGARDKTEASHLPSVSVLSNMPLDITGGQKLAAASIVGDFYLYSDLRLIQRDGDYIFVLRTTETDPVTGSARVYVVPLSYVVSLEIGQRFSASPTTVPMSTTVVPLPPSTTGVP